MPFILSNLEKALKTWRDKGLVIVGDKAEQNVSGKVLNIRSGALLKDVQDHQQPEGPAAFSIGTSLVYGKAWEMGFSRKAYTVRPRRAQALKIPIVGADEFIFRMRADIPAQTFAAKPFLHPAVRDSRKELTKLLGDQIIHAKLFSGQTIEIKLGTS
jgi:hypothetical protein